MVEDRFLEEAREAIRSGADLNRRGKDGIGLLHYWVSAGRVDIVDLLLSNGADANIRDDSGWTPLHFAAANGNLELVRLLVERGADVNTLVATQSSRSPLDRALGRTPRITPRRAALDAGHTEVADFLGQHQGRI